MIFQNMIYLLIFYQLSVFRKQIYCGGFKLTDDVDSVVSVSYYEEPIQLVVLNEVMILYLFLII